MQRNILSIFCPFLVAIITRVIYVLWGWSFYCAGYIACKTDWAKPNMDSIAYFNTFNWNLSWHYWGIVLILTFLAEMDIWRDPNDKNNKIYEGHTVYGLIFLIIVILFLTPSIASYLFAGGAWIFDFFSRSDKPATIDSNTMGGIMTVIGLGTYISCWKNNRYLNEMNWIGVIIGIILVSLMLFGIITPAFGYVVTSIILCGIYFTLCCIY